MKEALYLDADGTIWDVHPTAIASNCLPPYRREGNMLVGRMVTRKGKRKQEKECFIILREEARRIIDRAREDGMDVVLVTHNDPEPIYEAMFELELPFDRVYAGWAFDKFDLIEKDMKLHDIDYAYFVDDIYGGGKSKEWFSGFLFEEEFKKGLEEGSEIASFYSNIETFSNLKELKRVLE